ncbi:MAG TPA: hypothetical protein VH951_06035, partial [Dehalococcoidia bacterium]
MNEAEPAPAVDAGPAGSRPGLGLYLLVALLALAGGFLGVLGSLVAEIQRGGGFVILPVILGAPM